MASSAGERECAAPSHSIYLRISSSGLGTEPTPNFRGDGVDVGQEAIHTRLDGRDVGMEHVTDDQPFQPLPEPLRRIQVGGVGGEVHDLQAVLVLLPEGGEAFGMMDLGIIADQHQRSTGVAGEQSLHKPLKGLRGQIPGLLHGHRAAPDVDRSKEGDPGVMPVGRDLFLPPAEEPGGAKRLIGADVAFVLEQDYRVGPGVFFNVARASRKAACSAGRARFRT